MSRNLESDLRISRKAVQKIYHSCSLFPYDKHMIINNVYTFLVIQTRLNKDNNWINSKTSRNIIYCDFDVIRQSCDYKFTAKHQPMNRSQLWAGKSRFQGSRNPAVCLSVTCTFNNRIRTLNNPSKRFWNSQNPF